MKMLNPNHSSVSGVQYGRWNFVKMEKFQCSCFDKVNFQEIVDLYRDRCCVISVENMCDHLLNIHLIVIKVLLDYGAPENTFEGFRSFVGRYDYRHSDIQYSYCNQKY